MTQQEACKKLQDRYECEIYISPWGINFYHKSLYALISFEEDKQMFGNGNIWNKKKQQWSTGEFERADKLTFDQLYSIFDTYFPVKREIKLF